MSTTEANSLLGNLLDNAVEGAEAYPGKNCYVSLEITWERGIYIIKVTNTGEPLSREILERMFEKHYTTKEGNSGLGLSIAKEIADKYSGSIDVHFCNNEVVCTVQIPEK
ncbi:MAG: ATP-binding protein [Clostridiales bacterium]|nr:ATP-binding protein [Clostridiales bacterium]MCF8022469.1 ATP-binding protein [Clostridiales bacterium]